MVAHTLLGACVRAGISLFEARCWMLLAADICPAVVAGALGKSEGSVCRAAARARRKLDASPVVVDADTGEAARVQDALLSEAREVARILGGKQPPTGGAS